MIFWPDVASPYGHTALYAGGSTVIAPKFSASKFWETVEKYHITSFGSVATMLSMLLSSGQSSVVSGQQENPKSEIQNPKSGDGSIIIVIATDAPLDHRQLERLASRSMSGLARTGSSMTNGSGDYAIAFSTANRINAADKVRNVQVLGNDAMSPLFEAVIEATEEAIYNSMLRATTVTGKEKRTIEALPIDRVKELLRKYGKIR